MKDDGTPQNSPMTKGNGQGTVNTGLPTDAEILDELKDRFNTASEATSQCVKDALDDLKFYNGEQWPDRQRRMRESEGRPVLTINKLPTFVNQVTNDQRHNKISMKVSPVNEHASAVTAQIIQGMIRHIEYDSASDTAVMTAVNSATQIGFGYFRFITDYESPTSFNQVIKYARIRNPFTVYFDPASVQTDGSDAEWVIISDKMSKLEFKAKYPNAEFTIQYFSNLQPGDKANEQWIFTDQIRTAEYYRKCYIPATLYALSDGSVTTKLLNEAHMIMNNLTVIAQRETYLVKVMHYLCTPCEVLEKTEIKCSNIPVYPVYGTEVDIDGKINRFGIIRNAKDPATMYNYWMTVATEEVAMRPKTPYIGAKGQFKGEENRWKQSNQRSFAYLEYEPISVEGVLAPPPKRQPMTDIPSGMLTMAMHASDNIKATTGLFDSSLGAAGNAQSGKQELAQQRQGNIANYHYMDNCYTTLRRAGKDLVEMIPHYYDAERMVMVRGEDDTVKPAVINKYNAAAQKYENDVRVGRYQVAVTMGPSYATMRAEAVDSMLEMGKNWPKLMDVAGDKVVRTMSWPGAEDIADRISKTIPPEIRGAEDGEEEPIPPAAAAKIEQLTAQVKELAELADDNKTKLEIEEIRRQTTIQVEDIRAENKKDVQEIIGWVKLLVERINPPTALASEVGQGFVDAPPPPPANPAPGPGPVMGDEMSGGGIDTPPQM